jgi:hypothetical protein
MSMNYDDRDRMPIEGDASQKFREGGLARVGRAEF